MRTIYLKIFKNYSLAHIPTLALLIGLISFWLELFVIRLPYGKTSWMAWFIFILSSLLIFIFQKKEIIDQVKRCVNAWFAVPIKIKSIIVLVGVLTLAYFAISFYAS